MFCAINNLDIIVFKTYFWNSNEFFQALTTGPRHIQKFK